MFQVKTLRLQHSNQGAHLETRSKFCLYFFTELYTWKADFIELRNEKVKANVADFLKAFLCVNFSPFTWTVKHSFGLVTVVWCTFTLESFFSIMFSEYFLIFTARHLLIGMSKIAKHKPARNDKPT